jgi:hypothetical protein
MATKFGNNITVNGQDVASDSYKRIGTDARVIPTWYKYGGIRSATKYPTKSFHWKRLCKVSEIASITTEFANDRETVEIGKVTARTNDGKSFSTTITFRGNDVYDLMAMIGKDPWNSSTTGASLSPAIEVGRDYGVQGALIFAIQDENKKLMGSEILTDVGVKVLESPGAAEGETTYTVELYSKGEMFRAGHGMMFTPFFFYDDGTGTGVTNSSAPDGTATAFNIKNANNAFASAPSYSLAPQVVRPDAATNFDKYVVEARMGAQGAVNNKLASTGTQFDFANCELEFTTVPQDGRYLEGVIQLPTGFDNHDTTKTYWPGDIVKATDGDYYVQSATGSTVEVPASAATDWDVITDQQFPVPYLNDWDNELQHRNTTTQNYAGLSWLDFMSN